MSKSKNVIWVKILILIFLCLFFIFHFSFSTVYYGMGTSFTLNRLKELSPYCCRIRSKNDAGEGEYSKPKTFYTKAQPPSAIKGKTNYLFILYFKSISFMSIGIIIPYLLFRFVLESRLLLDYVRFSLPKPNTQNLKQFIRKQYLQVPLQVRRISSRFLSILYFESISFVSAFLMFF